MGLYNLIKKAAMGAILSGSIALGSGGLETKLNAQVEPPAVEWEKTFGGAGYDVGNSVQQTTDGGYVIVGTTLSFGGNLPKAYLLKTDSLGEKQWEKAHGFKGFGIGHSVQQTTDGEYIITGITVPQEDGSGGGYAIYLLKTDSLGEKQWEKTFGRIGEINKGFSVQQTTDGSYIIGGNTTFDSYPYLLKTDSLGEKQWEKTFGKVPRGSKSFAQQTTDEGYIIFDNGLLLKTDSLGEKQWEKTFGAGLISIQQTTDEGYIMIGTKNISPPTLENYKVYLLKTDSLGEKQWEKTFGETRRDHGYSVQQTTDEGFIIGYKTSLFGPDAAKIYLLKTDSLGEKQWERTFRGSNNISSGLSVQQTNDGSYIVAGSTNSFGAGDEDVYLVKLAPEKPFPVCNENWQCASWSSCVDGQQTRTCTDLNNCGTANSKPPIVQSCTPPAPEVKGATKDYFPPRTPTAKNLTFVTHGRNDNVNGWVFHTARSVLEKLIEKNEAQNWDVWIYDWRNEADVAIGKVASNAADQGDIVGPALSAAGYEHLHLIAHSAGSWLIEYASRRLENRDSKTIHLTFLDAYALPDSPLGEDADWAEHYVSKGLDIFNDPPFTNETLAFAHNIDITGLTTNGSHSWPHEWYLKSINTESINNSKLLSYFSDWGFAKSKEYLGHLPSHDDFPKGETTTLPLHEILLSPNEISNGDFSSGNTEKWATQGNVTAVEFPQNSGNLAAQLTTASLVSISQNIKTPNSLFLINFDHAFKSSTGNTTINLGGTTIAELSSETALDSGFSRNNYVITDSKLRNLETILTFTHNGDTGSQAILDNISLNAIAPFELPLRMRVPRIDRLRTAIPTDKGSLELNLNLGYNSRGKIIRNGDSIIGCETSQKDVSITGKMQLIKRSGDWKYSITAKYPDKEKGMSHSLKVVGIYGQETANFNYSGPCGKVKGVYPVEITGQNNLEGLITLSPNPCDVKGSFTGIGKITSGFNNDCGQLATLSGKKTSKKLSWTLSCGNQKISFKGKIMPEAQEPNGKLTIKLPPDKFKINDLSIKDIFCQD